MLADVDEFAEEVGNWQGYVVPLVDHFGVDSLDFVPQLLENMLLCANSVFLQH